MEGLGARRYAGSVARVTEPKRTNATSGAQSAPRAPGAETPWPERLPPEVWKRLCGKWMLRR